MLNNQYVRVILAALLVCVLIGGMAGIAVAANEKQDTSKDKWVQTDMKTGTTKEVAAPTQGDKGVTPKLMSSAGAKTTVVQATNDKANSRSATSASTTSTATNSIVGAGAAPSKLWSSAFGITTGYDEFYNAIPDSTGIIAAGYENTGSAYGNEMFLVHTTMNNVLNWAKRAPGISTDQAAKDVQRTSDGNYIVAGYTVQGANQQAALYKVNATTHNVMWSKAYGGPSYEDFKKVVQTADGGYVAVGSTESAAYSLYRSQIYLVRTDAKGNMLWQRHIGGNGFEFANGLCYVPGSGFVIAGSSSSWNAYSNDNAYLIRTDGAGMVINTGTWEAIYGPSAADASSGFNSVIKDGSSSVVAGFKHESGSSNDGVWIAQISASGSMTQNAVSSSLIAAEYANGLVKAPDGSGYVTADARQYSGGDRDGLLVKFSSDLSTVTWAAGYDGSNIGAPYDKVTDFNSIATTSTGYIISGRSTSWDSTGADYQGLLLSVNFGS